MYVRMSVCLYVNMIERKKYSDRNDLNLAVLVNFSRLSKSVGLLIKKQNSTFLPERRYASAGNSDRNVSVRLSVRHAPVLCQNEES